MRTGINLFNVKLFSALLVLYFSHTNVYAGSMCAEVKIQINQEATLERQAFDARMKINNGMADVSLKNVKIDIKFTDKEGNPVVATTNANETGAKFFYRLDSIDNVDSIDGSGIIAPSKSAEIHWLIIPSPGSAGVDGTGSTYYVGAELSYTLSGQQYTMDVTPDFIFVKPMPDLVLDYFLPKEVYGDDPFTEETEPSIPFSLGLRVRNQGKGAAKNLKIDSAQPRIIENKQGLLIDFVIQGSSVNDSKTEPTLLADIGDIKSGKAANVRWDMTSSLTGRFVSFDAVMTHADELGGKLTSLIKSENINTHELVQNVIADLPGRDELKDFLGKAGKGSIYKLYESNGNTLPVNDKSGESSFAKEGTNT